MFLQTTIQYTCIIHSCYDLLIIYYYSDEDASSVRQRLEKDLHTARTALHERKSKTEEIKNESQQPKPSLETEQEVSTLFLLR